MNYKNAEEIIKLYEHYNDIWCTCFQGNAPCGKCESMPSDEDYERALQRIERGF